MNTFNVISADKVIGIIDAADLASAQAIASAIHKDVAIQVRQTASRLLLKAA